MIKYLASIILLMISLQANAVVKFKSLDMSWSYSIICIYDYTYVIRDKGISPIFGTDGKPMLCTKWLELYGDD